MTNEENAAEGETTPTPTDSHTPASDDDATLSTKEKEAATPPTLPMFSKEDEADETGEDAGNESIPLEVYESLDIRNAGGVQLIGLNSDVAHLPAVKLHLWIMEKRKQPYQTMSRGKLMSNSIAAGAAGVGCLLLPTCCCGGVLITIATQFL